MSVGHRLGSVGGQLGIDWGWSPPPETDTQLTSQGLAMPPKPGPGKPSGQGPAIPSKQGPTMTSERGPAMAFSVGPSSALSRDILLVVAARPGCKYPSTTNPDLIPHQLQATNLHETWQGSKSAGGLGYSIGGPNPTQTQDPSPP